MPDWTDIEITRLIACSKSVSVAPKKEMKEEFRHRRNDMKLGSGGGEQFEVFMRQSLEFQEDFSIGLVFLSPEGKSILLIRFNGQHDQANDMTQAVHPHFNFHIHKATANNLNDGIYNKLPAEISSTYASFNEALAEFCEMTNIDGWEKLFPTAEVLPLFKQRQ